MRWSRLIRRRFAADALAVVAAVAVAGSALLPWHRSGRVTRDGFALARVADGLGLVTGAPRRALFVGVFLLPLLAALAFGAAVAGRRQWTGALVVAAGVVGLGSAFVVFRALRFGESGPVFAVVAGLAAVVCGCRLLLGKEGSR
jgi:hypothetical protein